MTARPFLTPDQLVQRWEGRIKRGTLANWRARTPPAGPAFTKTGGRVLYPLDQVEAYEQANTTANTTTSNT